MSENASKLLSVKEAAERLEVTRVRVNQLIDAGMLAAQKVGRSYVIQESDVETLRAQHRTAGRPAKVKTRDGE